MKKMLKCFVSATFVLMVWNNSAIGQSPSEFALLDRTRVKDSTETQKYLKSVISKRPNSRAARFAEQMLNLEKK